MRGVGASGGQAAPSALMTSSSMTSPSFENPESENKGRVGSGLRSRERGPWDPGDLLLTRPDLDPEQDLDLDLLLTQWPQGFLE